MEGNDLTVGRRYGFRLKRRVGEPLIQVHLLEKVGRKGLIKIRHIDGSHPGLEEYARTSQIVTSWKQRLRFFRDEDRLKRVHDLSKAVQDRALKGAIETVLYSTGHPDAGLSEDGSLHMSEASVRNIAARGGLSENPQDLHPAGFVDRSGQAHLPLQGAEGLARAFAAAEPATVTLYIDDTEQEYLAGGYQPGDRWLHDFLREKQAGFALARQWAGHEQEVAQLRNEIERLQGILRTALWDLKQAGAEQQAARIGRALQGR